MASPVGEGAKLGNNSERPKGATIAPCRAQPGALALANTLVRAVDRRPCNAMYLRPLASTADLVHFDQRVDSRIGQPLLRISNNVGIALGLDFLKDFSTPPSTTKLALLEKRVARRVV